MPNNVPVRLKRDPQRTRSAILSAAQRRLIEYGPDGLRLQEIAADAGVSHPLILHHFGSREGLVVALISHVGQELLEEVLRLIPSGPGGGAYDRSLKVEAVFAALSDRKMGLLLAWAMGQAPQTVSQLIAEVVERIQASLYLHHRGRDGEPTSPDWWNDVRHSMRLVFLSAVGDCIVGRAFPGQPGEQEAFRLWLAQLVADRAGI
jgi:AcrR family transcriptional regulator